MLPLDPQLTFNHKGVRSGPCQKIDLKQILGLEYKIFWNHPNFVRQNNFSGQIWDNVRNRKKCKSQKINPLSAMYTLESDQGFPCSRPIQKLVIHRVVPGQSGQGAPDKMAPPCLGAPKLQHI